MHDTLDRILQDGIDRGAAPGAAFVVVDRDGVQYAGAAGERVIGSGVSMTPDSVGAIFSMTKAMTGVAVMQLVEQGRLDLDAPAAEVCPSIGRSEVLTGFDDDGQPLTRPAASPVTLRHLLTHTSGYVYDFWNADLARWYEATGTPNILSSSMASVEVPLMFDPGTEWAYGIGIDWAGLMLEAVTGETLGEYFTEHLTGPLGMHDTGFAPTPAMLERFAAMHARGDDGSFTPMELPMPDAPDFEQGGGGLAGTAADYARFVQMVLNDGELDGTRILGADTVATMAQNHIGDLRVTELSSIMPPLSHDAEFFPGEPKSWGLTWQINEAPAATGRPAGTLMWAGLSNCYKWIDRSNGIGGVYVSQILPFADPGSLGLFFELETAVYQARS